MDQETYPGDPYWDSRTPGSGEGGNMLKGITGLAMFVAVIAAALGLVFGGTELLNPGLAEARAGRITEETAALASKNAYEQSLRQIEIERQRALAQKELDWYDRKIALMEDAAAVLVPGLFLGSIGLGIGGGVYLASLGFDVLRRRRLVPQAIQSERGKILPFPPDPMQRFRRQPRHLPEGTA